MFTKNKTKCPYCKETIKIDAIKCKHCGEWIIKESLKEDVTANNENLQIEKTELIEQEKEQTKELEIDENEEVETHDCIFCGSEVKINSKEKKQRFFTCPACEKKNKLFDNEKDKIRKNIPLGFGWYIVAGMLFSGFMKDSKHKSPEGLLFIMIYTTIFVLIYMYVRKRILLRRYKKNGYFGKVYSASIISYSILAITLFLLMILFEFILNYFVK